MQKKKKKKKKKKMKMKMGEMALSFGADDAFALPVRCFGSTFRPKPGWLECLSKFQDNIMLNNKLSQLSRG